MWNNEGILLTLMPLHCKRDGSGIRLFATAILKVTEACDNVPVPVTPFGLRPHFVTGTNRLRLPRQEDNVEELLENNLTKTTFSRTMRGSIFGYRGEAIFGYCYQPRGAKITERLPELLMNYGGIKTVAAEFYRDVFSTCARACREPAANIREMKDFVKRYEAHWADCARQPE